MSSIIPFVVVLLAIIAAVSIAYIAWELSSDEFHKSFERKDERAVTSDGADDKADAADSDDQRR